MDGRTVLVTGCSGGFGRATAMLLARRGWQVFATTRDPRRQPDLEACVSAGTGHVKVVALDLEDSASISTAVHQVLEITGGRLYGVVHNAGVGDAGFFEDVSEEAFRRVLETNFFGAVALTRAVLPAMRRAGCGRIIAVSSSAVFFAYPWQTAYVASKCALEGWAECLAVELRPFGIQVALLEPGMHRTGIWEASRITRPAGGPYQAWAAAIEERMRRMAARRGGDPQRVARAVAATLEAPRVRLRRPIGPDAWGARLAGALPEPIRRPIRRTIFGRPVVKSSSDTRPDG